MISFLITMLVLIVLVLLMSTAVITLGEEVPFYKWFDNDFEIDFSKTDNKWLDHNILFRDGDMRLNIRKTYALNIVGYYYVELYNRNDDSYKKRYWVTRRSKLHKQLTQFKKDCENEIQGVDVERFRYGNFEIEPTNEEPMNGYIDNRVVGVVADDRVLDNTSVNEKKYLTKG